MLLRVGLLCTLALGAGWFLSGPSGPGDAASTCSSVPDVITHGPRLGEVTDQSVKVWARACQEVSVSVEYKLTTEDWSAAQQSSPVLAAAAGDYTAVAQLTGLNPETEYDYRLLVEGQVPSKSFAGQFRTLPPEGSESTLSFIVASDMHYPWDVSPGPGPAPLLDVMAQRDADFSFMIGDQIVIEIVINESFGHCCLPWSQAEYEYAYQGMSAYQAFRDFAMNTPLMMTWDDHEIANDWNSGTASPYPWARAAFDEYIGSANPASLDPSGVQYIYRAGQVEFFVLDTRTYRDPAGTAGNCVPAESMLGADQKAALKNWLLTSDARFKFIISSVMWSSLSGHAPPFFCESWPTYLTERDEIFDFIKDNQIPGVILYSGDEHAGRVFRMMPWDLYEFAPAPLGWKVGASSNPDPEILFQSSYLRLFGLFEVDTTTCPATLTAQLIRHDNQPAYTLALDEMDLGADPDLDGLPPCQEEQLGTDWKDADTDDDGCTDSQEIGPDQTIGGLRDPTNGWDYFNPSGDGQNRVDDVLLVLSQYYIDAGNPAYNGATDRTLAGPNPWNLGPPNGQQRVDDILHMLNQYYHDCP
jgi:alkaline phosphatase D